MNINAYQKVVTAALKILYSPQMRPMLINGLHKGPNVAQNIANEVAGLLKMVDGRADMKIPKEVMAPAAITILADLFKFVQEAGVQVSDDDVKEAAATCLGTLIDEYHAMGVQNGAA